jgi:hypothetical protein
MNPGKLLFDELIILRWINILGQGIADRTLFRHHGSPYHDMRVELTLQWTLEERRRWRSHLTSRRRCRVRVVRKGNDSAPVNPRHKKYWGYADFPPKRLGTCYEYQYHNNFGSRGPLLIFLLPVPSIIVTDSLATLKIITINLNCHLRSIG